MRWAEVEGKGSASLDPKIFLSELDLVPIHHPSPIPLQLRGPRPLLRGDDF